MGLNALFDERSSRSWCSFSVSWGPALDGNAGLVWMTSTKNSKVIGAHSVSGSENVWQAPYQLPTPNGERNMTADDISATLGTLGFQRVVLGDNATRRFCDLRVDGVVLAR